MQILLLKSVVDSHLVLNISLAFLPRKTPELYSPFYLKQ